jgi:hypothetical protein
MPRTASESVGLSTARIKRRQLTTIRFYALDGSHCVLIEADSEDDARYLCSDMRLEFIGICEK